MSDRIVYIRIPQPIIEIVDAAVSAKLYKDRAEILRECIRNGVKELLYNGCGGFCPDSKKMVDCCTDENCRFKKKNNIAEG